MRISTRAEVLTSRPEWMRKEDYDRLRKLQQNVERHKSRRR